MDYSKATDEQLKTIIEWDDTIPTHLLKEVYEEIIKRRVLDGKICSWIIHFFKFKENAERKTRMEIEELKWICYETGYEAIKGYKPGHPFVAYWYRVAMRRIKDIARYNNSLKRKGETLSLEIMDEWREPGGNNTEPIAINRVYIDNLMSQLTEVEKEIVIMRYQGYINREIGARQGVSRHEIERRIKKYQKRLKGA